MQDMNCFSSSILELDDPTPVGVALAAITEFAPLTFIFIIPLAIKFNRFVHDFHWFICRF